MWFVFDVSEHLQSSDTLNFFNSLKGVCTGRLLYTFIYNRMPHDGSTWNNIYGIEYNNIWGSCPVRVKLMCKLRAAQFSSVVRWQMDVKRRKPAELDIGTSGLISSLPAKLCFLFLFKKIKVVDLLLLFSEWLHSKTPFGVCPQLFIVAWRVFVLYLSDNCFRRSLCYTGTVDVLGHTDICFLLSLVLPLGL